MFSTITAKFPSICKRCHGEIRRGDRIRYAGPGRTYHLAADCSSSTRTDDSRTETTTASRRLSLTCPTCKTPNALTAHEAHRGYQCYRCTRADEGPGAPDVFFAPPD